MREALLLLPLALVAAGCEREPTFDERYAETQKRIGEKSRELDRELAGQAVTTSPAEDNPELD